MAPRPLAWIANSVAVQSTSRLFYLFLITFVLSLSVRADDDTSLLPSAASDSFPQCALSCSILQQAQSACIPPSAPANGRSTYVSCFCQSSLISSLHNSADGTCTDTCTNASDRSLLKTWYTNFCSSGGKSTTSDSTAASSSSASTSTSGAKSQNSYPAPPTWWSTHYQWVIMVIVLIVGFSALAALGVWLKRRHDAKYPNLYHAGSGSNSGLLFNRGQNSSPGPKQPGQFMPTPSPVNHPEYANTDSVASSSNTDVAAPRTRTPLRLQKTPQPTDEGDVEIREVPR